MYKERGNTRGSEENHDIAGAESFQLVEDALEQITREEAKDAANYPPLPGNEGHRMTITPFHGEVYDRGEHGYRHVPVHMDVHDASHDLDDPDPDTNRFVELTDLLS